MPKPQIVVVGSSNTDMIIKVEHFPRPGETVLGGEFFTAAGGKGANQAVAAARAGGSVSFIARVGQDALGTQAVKGLIANGIDVTHVTRDRSAASGAALIFVAGNGENSIAVAGGANARLSPADVRKARTAWGGAQVALMQLESPLPTIEAAATLAGAKGARIILNPAPAYELPDRLLRRISILTPNEGEAERLTGIKVKDLRGAERAAHMLCRRGVATVILTLGERGALIANEEGTQLIPGFKVKAVDTTAAGDIFNGALAVALTEGKPLERAVRFANAAAALSVMRLGAQPSAPKRRSIDRFLRAR